MHCGDARSDPTWQVFIVPGINKHIAQGFPIPTIAGLTFVNPEVWLPL